MKFFKFGSKIPAKDSTETAQTPRLVFASTSALERTLDGTDEVYQRYFYALYQCSPDEPAGINEYREQLRKSNPKNAVQVGRHFVLWGNEAFQALVWYYEALSDAPTLPDEFRAYAKRRVQEITSTHQKSQGLPVPLDLSEGQLSNDPNLAFYAYMALLNQQIVPQSKAV